MANTFPAQVTRTDENGNPVEIAGVVAQVDLGGLANELAPRLADPDNLFTSSDVSPRPDPAPPTAGPHRYTIYVPHNDEARINVGAPHPTRGETGVTVDTKTHIHLSASGSTNTFLSLGAAPLNNGSDMNKQTAGYSLQTDGAWNSLVKNDVTLVAQTGAMNLAAEKNVRIDSKTEGIQLTSAKHLTVSGHGNVEISAGVDAPISADFWSLTNFGAMALAVVDGADFLAPAAGYKGGATEAGTGAVTGAASFLSGLADGDAAKLRDQWVAKYAGGVDKVLGHLATTAGLVLGFKKQWKKPKHGRATWEDGFGWVSWIVSMGAEINAIIGDLSASKENDSGDVKIKAQAAVSIEANSSVSISGAKGVSISGFKGASMSGLTAGIKGHKEGTVWGGLGASLKALAGDAVVSSDLKGASVKAKKDVEMSSETAKATLTGNLDTQVNSITAKTFVHGKTMMFAGTTEFGVVAKPDFASIGALTGAAEFGSADFDDHALVVKKDEVIVSSTGDNYLYLTDSEVELKGKKVTIDGGSGNVTIKGKLIELN